jgi:hypothetical protein
LGLEGEGCMDKSKVFGVYLMENEKPDFVLAHKYSINNKESIMKSEKCGCFHCLAIYPPSKIDEWIPDKYGETAICPKCGIDSVIGSESGYPIKRRFLFKMRRCWF